MKKVLLILIIFFYSKFSFSADTKLPTFGFSAYLVCENISHKDELIANRYYLLESDKITLLKSWVNSFIADQANGFRHFDNEQKAVKKIIKENEHHIFFDKVELDKIKGILSMKTEDEKDLFFKCKIINKDAFFLAR